MLAEALSLGAELGVLPTVMRPALQNGPTDSRTLRELEEMRFTWYEKDIDNAVKMAATVDRELVLSPFVAAMRDIDLPGDGALLAGRGRRSPDPLGSAQGRQPQPVRSSASEIPYVSRTATPSPSSRNTAWSV